MGRFWRYENATVDLIPVDAENPRLGGKVSVSAWVFDARTLTPSKKNYFGVYGEDFITFGEYKKDAKYPIDDEETLLKIFDEEDQSVIDKHSFKFENDQITYSREVNGEELDAEIEHSIAET